MASPIGLISAVPIESNIILRNLKNSHEKDHRGMTILKGTLGDTSVVSVTSGIGKTNASRGTTLLIEKFAPDIIIHLGVGGAYPSSGLKMGDIAIADEEIYGDEGILLADGFHTVEKIGIPFLIKAGKQYFNEFPLDKKLVKMALRISRVMYQASRVAVKSGPFLTLSTCTGTLKRARELEKTFHAICENMEGAAVAHVCAFYGTPMVEIRGISNIVGERDKRKWDINLAAENCQRLVMELLKKI